MNSVLDGATTGELPVVKARVGWVGEPQHTRPPGWPGPEADWACSVPRPRNRLLSVEREPRQPLSEEQS